MPSEVAIEWRHLRAASAARAAGPRADSHGFIPGALISACSRVDHGDPRLEAAERPGDRRCRACLSAIARHGGDVAFGVINVDLATHSVIQDEALRRGCSMREVADECVRRALAAEGIQ
jgi:hypothetical protein